MLLSVFFLPGMMAACRYESNLFITTPQTMEALSGSCLQIPCNFSAKPEHEFNQGINFGVWIKNNPFSWREPNNVIYNSNGKVTTYPMNITGNLSQNDCTTLFSRMNSTYDDTYYFRIQSSKFKAAAVCDPVRIIVKDSPRSPSIEISGDLKEKESVTITCSAFTPCPHSPPKLTWNLQQHSHNMEENTDGTFTTKIQETITLSDKHDGYNITCSAKYPVNEGQDVKIAEETKTLSVSYSPRDPSVIISPTGPVSVGSRVNLTCSCRRKPPVVQFSWFVVSDGRLELIKVDSQVYGLNVTAADRGRLFFCGYKGDVDPQLSKGCQLTFEGDQHVGVQLVLKILGIMMLISTLVIFECWFRSRGSVKRMEDTVEPDYVNTVALGLSPKVHPSQTIPAKPT
uniref:B-cell receptor CD22-like n=1 Tax=Semicossyphus pulcher TaxID=241346 RepID=UPI0037E8737B